jgi:RNA polymerase subunit RPABC4/transcription elongation factor Spt4
MKCPVCVESGLTSLVSSSPVGTTPVGGMEYWDEGEKFHVHNPNYSVRRFQCTNGHRMMMMQFNSCPSCEYNEGRTELYLEDVDKNTVAKYRFTKDKQWKKVVTFDAK